MNPPLQAVVLAAGRGTRMRSRLPKVLHVIFGRPLLDYPLLTLRELGIERPVVVVGWGKEKILSHLNGRAQPVIQSPQRGTGHALQIARGKLGSFRGDLLIWPADMPLIQKETIQKLIRAHRKSKAAVTILSSLMVDPEGGRILRRGGSVVGIREEADATLYEKRCCEVNTGVYLFKPKALFEALKKITPNNRQNEYYLTDTIRLIDEAGGRIEALPFASPGEAQGINSQADLARATRLMTQQTLKKLQMRGVTIVAPEQTWIAPDAAIGQETVIYPWTYIEGKVRVGRRCQIGPFAKVGSGSVIEDGAVIGSFVEVTRSRIGKKVLAKHLTYLGDAVVGEGTNIGAGTITANYDGKRKSRTRIGKRAFIGVDTLFVAPATVENQGRTGAGAVVTRGMRVKRGKVYVGVPAKPIGAKGHAAS